MSLADDIEMFPPNECLGIDVDYRATMWTPSKGKPIYIFEMKTSHLLNTIRFLKGRGITVPYEMLREIYYREKYVTIDAVVETDAIERESISYNGDN